MRKYTVAKPMLKFKLPIKLCLPPMIRCNGTLPYDEDSFRFLAFLKFQTENKKYLLLKHSFNFKYTKTYSSCLIYYSTGGLL